MSGYAHDFTWHGRGKVSAREVFQTSRGGEIVTLVFECGDKYPQSIPVKCFSGLADDIKKGMTLEVSGHLGGREWNGKFYGDIIADTIKVVGGEAVQSVPAHPPSDDDVPF